MRIYKTTEEAEYTGYVFEIEEAAEVWYFQKETSGFNMYSHTNRDGKWVYPVHVIVKAQETLTNEAGEAVKLLEAVSGVGIGILEGEVVRTWPTMSIAKERLQTAGWR